MRAVEVVDGMLKCSKCGQTKPVSEFSKGQNKSGYRSQCKQCVHEVYLSDKGRILQQHKDYYEANKDSYLDACKAYRNSHREQTRKTMHEYYLRNGEKIRERSKKQFANFTPEQMKKRKEYLHSYYTTEEGRSYKRRKFHERKSAELLVESSLTDEEWLNTVKFFDGRCAYCGKSKKLTQDHIVPVSKGGGYTKNNIIPCCGSCNSSKQDKDFMEWYASKPYFAEERLNRIKEIMRY